MFCNAGIVPSIGTNSSSRNVRCDGVTRVTPKSLRMRFARATDARANYSEILEQTGAGPDHVVHLDHPSWDDMLGHGRAA